MVRHSERVGKRKLRHERRHTPEFETRGCPSPTSAGLSLGLAYVLGLIAATGVCLPSFYFYGLLSGVRITVLQVTTHITEGMAATALMLLGLLPIYVAYVLGLIVFEAPSSSLGLEV